MMYYLYGRKIFFMCLEAKRENLIYILSILNIRYKNKLITMIKCDNFLKFSIKLQRSFMKKCYIDYALSSTSRSALRKLLGVICIYIVTLTTKLFSFVLYVCGKYKTRTFVWVEPRSFNIM